MSPSSSGVVMTVIPMGSWLNDTRSTPGGGGGRCNRLMGNGDGDAGAEVLLLLFLRRVNESPLEEEEEEEEAFEEDPRCRIAAISISAATNSVESMRDCAFARLDEEEDEALCWSGSKVR